MSGAKIKVTIKRYYPQRNSSSYYQFYSVPFKVGMSIANVLQYITENIDGSLAYYLSCRRGICAGCGVKVNGKPVLACTEIVKGDITIEPLDNKRVIKDVVTE